MKTIAAAAPDFAAELSAALAGEGEEPLAVQLIRAQITHLTYDDTADAGYIYLEPPVAPIPSLHREAAKVKKTIPFGNPHWFNIDVDHEGYAFGVEVLGRKDVIAKLKSAAL